MTISLLKISVNKVPDEIELEKRCWSCGWEAQTPSVMASNGKCDICGGLGTVLTEDGKIILDLVRKYLNARIERL